MKKYQDVIGLDVSKKTLDVVDSIGNHRVVSNDLQGFKKLAKMVRSDCVCVMEATGVYHLQLATFLHSKSISVAVINPLRIKRFIQMHLKRNKTDKSDAQMICLYAQTQAFDLWEPMDPSLTESVDAYQTMEQYINARASFKNKLEELKSKNAAAYLLRNVEYQIVNLSQSIKELEQKVKELIKVDHAELLSNLESIVGIGQRTATLLIMSSNGFKHFDSGKQLASYYGLAPRERESGTSIKGRSTISKMGNPLVRKKIYMCSLQASRNNTACSALYQRLLAKGKPKKLALIAVANKLVRIVYAIAKSGNPYDPQYRSFRTTA